MKSTLFSSNFLLKILECIILSVIFLIDKPNIYIIIPVLACSYILNKLSKNKDKNTKYNYDKITLYDFIVETSSLIYFFFIFGGATIIYKASLYIISIILILFENYIKKINLMTKIISHDMIAIPFIVLLLMSLPR